MTTRTCSGELLAQSSGSLQVMPWGGRTYEGAMAGTVTTGDDTLADVVVVDVQEKGLARAESSMQTVVASERVW